MIYGIIRRCVISIAPAAAIALTMSGTAKAQQDERLQRSPPAATRGDRGDCAKARVHGRQDTDQHHGGQCTAALQAVEDAARTGENVMPKIIAAVEAFATVGEISDAMRRVFGEYKEAVVI